MNLIKELLYRLRGEYTTEKLISMGMTVGKNFGRLNGVILDPSHCWLITIGDNVTMAPRVHILCHDASTKGFLGYTKIGRVNIGDNVFIGAESVVLPGVNIGNNVIIGGLRLKNDTVNTDGLLGYNVIAYYNTDEEKLVYNTDNQKLTSVLDLCKNTIKYSTQDKFQDCPIREKGTYLGDLMVAGRAHAILTGDFTMLKHAVRGFIESDVICHSLMAVSRSSFMQQIADYSLVLPALVNWIYREDGDLQFLAECEPVMSRMYAYFCRYERPDGLIERVHEWNMVDWPTNLRDGYDFPLTKPIGAGVHNVINALWYGFKLAMNETYAALGKGICLDAQRTQNAYVAAFYSADTGLYTDSPDTAHTAVHSSVFALLFGIGTDDKQIRSNLIEHIKHKRLTSMSVYAAYFALAALKLAGEYELCVDLATDDGAWLNMISEGATLTFEAWGKDQKWNTSLCHPWAVAPLIIFADGISPY